MVESISKNEYYIKCGEMKIENGKVKPSSVKGQVKIFTNNENFLCWQWFSLEQNAASEPLVIFSDEWEWVRVNVKKGRVFQLKSKCFDDVYLYWIQDSDVSKDEKMENDVKKILSEGKIDDSLSMNKKNNNNNNPHNAINTNQPSNTNNFNDLISQALRMGKGIFLLFFRKKSKSQKSFKHKSHSRLLEI